MTATDFTTTFLVDQAPDEAFTAITNVRGWWSGEIDGPTDQLGQEFTYRYKDVHYSRQRVTELVPGRRVVWRVLDACLNFTDDPGEWAGTVVVFEITPVGGQTEVRFSHLGLVPGSQCFDRCSSAWGPTSTPASGCLRPRAKPPICRPMWT